MLRKLGLTLLVGLLLVSFSQPASAIPVELVVNGEFEDPFVSPGTFAGLSSALVPGWSSTSLFEIWGSTFNPGGILPALGTDGLPHGQHHEINFASTSDITTQSIAIGADGTADFSFDTWRRFSSSVSYDVSGSLSGTLASDTFSFAGSSAWHNISALGLSVLAGETVTLTFSSLGSACCGAHIDQVSLMYEEAITGPPPGPGPGPGGAPVPEPGTLLLLGSGLVGLVFYSRKKARLKNR